MNFRVRVGEKDLPVEFIFAVERDLFYLEHWRSPQRIRNNPHVQDALEYRRLASKRWRTYQVTGRTAGSLQEIEQAINKDPNAEVVFVMLARALWHTPSPILGFCFCRRTWCHHVVLDFAAAHPNAIGPAGGEVRGVGAGMLYSLVQVADSLDVRTIWGEATGNSAKFYMKALSIRRVLDHFFIRGRTRRHCLQQFKLVAWQ
ncbi:MAG TPA: hypothetical protein VGO67_00595 [Verrucomicrobiae bacterium]|jgi:hypothetical protein